LLSERSRSHVCKAARSSEAWSLHLLCEIRLAGDSIDLDAALGYSQQAIAFAEELGMRPLIAHCHFVQARIMCANDQRGRAQTSLETAITMYRDMGMTFWADRAAAETR
jgi:hypothetical protein